MKIVMDERLKYRLIGLAVLLSVAALFIPLAFKKANQHFDENNFISIKLPLKPMITQIDVPDEERLFSNVKVAHVEIPTIPAVKAIKISAANNKIESLSKLKNENKFKAVRVAAQEPDLSNHLMHSMQKTESPSVAVKVTPPTKQQVSAKKVPIIVKDKPGYTVQLAMFSDKNNAISLVKRLKQKGYTATYARIQSAKGIVYKVTAGQTTEKQQALNLQRQIASSVQIKGFIVPTVIS